jgi:trimethylamine:corrinoid methyltransferase-like protein
MLREVIAMDRVGYGVTGGLTEEQLGTLHERALEALTGVGMEVGNPGLLAFLSGRPGFRADGTRVRFARALLDECVAESRALGGPPAPAPNGSDWQVTVLSGYPTHVTDWQGDGVRPMTEPDVIELTKLVDVLHDEGVRGSTPGVPQDAPPEVRDIRCFRIGAEHCREGGVINVSSLDSAEWLYRMAEVLGHGRGLAVFVVSPLRAEGVTFDALYRFRDSLHSVGVGSMPMMGLSAPVHVMGAFVISVASVWGAWAIARELTGKRYFGVECRIWPVSMRSGDVVYGTPEMVFSDLVSAQLRAFYGWRGMECDGFHSSANVADLQAAAQRGAYGMAVALAGRREFRFGGLLGVDLVFSPVQLLLDVELVRYYRHVTEGFPFGEDAFCMDAIANVGPTGSFLGDDSTVRAFREVFWESSRFASEPLGRWMANGARSFTDRAQEEIAALIARHDFHLPDDQAREIARIARAAEAELLG